MTRLLITFTLLAMLLLGCAGQTNSARPDDDGEGFEAATESTEESATQGQGSESADADADTEEQAQQVDAEGTDSPVGDSAAQPLPEPLTGTLGLENVEGGCAFLEASGQRYELIAGPDATIVLDEGSGAITDGEGGDVIAEVGDTITVDGAIDPGTASFCQSGQVLLVESITAG